MIKNKLKKPLFYILGTVMIVVGVSRTLVWWEDLAVLFRGSIGSILTVGGLLILYSLKNK